MAEDLSPRIGAFGDSVASTPNIDQLAAEGVTYTSVFTTAGVCAPSRAAMILGQHQISTGGQHMRTSTRPEGAYFAVPPAEVKAFPELLRKAGYYTYTDLKLDYQFSGAFANSGPFTIWDQEGVEQQGWTPRQSNQPFFGWRNFMVTHESGIFLPLGSWPNNSRHLLMQLYRWWLLDDVDEITRPDDINVPPYYPDTSTVRADMARHYDNIAAMDQQVGEILRDLEEAGLSDSTIIIWTTDHGDGLPRAKRELYDSGIHIPMIIRFPEKFRPEGVKPGSTDDRLISAIDFAPTVLKLGNAELPNYLQGSSFLDSNREYILASRDRIDEIPDRQRAIRDHRYKYIRSWYPELAQGHPLRFRDNILMVRKLHSMHANGQLNDEQSQWFEPVGEERLYDLAADPHELKNLAGDDEHNDVLLRMRAALDQQLAAIPDLSDITETKMVQQFNTYPEQPLTNPPKVDIEDCKLILAPATNGSSIAWRQDSDEQWQLYVSPVDICSMDTVEISAVRYGWQQSESVTVSLN